VGGEALTEACEKGCTVVYDEFTRSRPRPTMCCFSAGGAGAASTGKHIAVHPISESFHQQSRRLRGVHGAQDALLDRMVTILLSGFDQATEAGITQAHSGLPLRRSRGSWPWSAPSAMRGSRPAAPASGRPS